jgi:uncharacterized protein HemX
MKRIIELWKTLSLPHQAMAIGGLLLVVMLASGGVGGFISHWKDKAFERKQAAYQKQLDALTVERTAAVSRAELYEKQAAELEAKVKINEAIIAAAGSRAEAAQKELVKEDEKFNQAMRDADIDVDSCTRQRNICESAKRLGYFPKNKECLCTE